MKTANVLRALAATLTLALIASLGACGDNKDCVGDECETTGVEVCGVAGDEDDDGAADCDDTDCAADPACQPQCGNGIQNIGEGCDDANQVDTDACTNTCQRARCGDGITQAGVEQCDDANDVDTDACTNACRTATCGDGIVGPGEQCDDMNNVNTDACTNACRTATCGDGIVGPGEQCDDMNNVDTDACTNACETAVCGDMIVRAGVEQCDDGNMVNTDGCTNACQTARCGDGFTGPGEACDDGNMVNTDACTNMCRLPSCGDGFMQAGEQCDDGNMVNTDGCLNTCMTATCGDGVTQAGVEQCDDMNQVDTDACRNSCQSARCGDAVVQAGVEQCDDGNLTNTDTCTNACTTARCGDGFMQAGEVCDDGNMNNGDGCDNTCQPSGCGNGVIGGMETCDDGNASPGDGCSATCATEAGFTCNMMPSMCVTTCGDGIVAGLETCDQGGGNVADGDGCSMACQLEAGFACGGTPSACAATCGNGTVDANEVCDDSNLVNNDGCSPSCRFAIGCGPGETQVAVTNAASTPVGDLATTNSQVMINAPNTVVSKLVVYLGNLTHSFDGDLDLALVGPRGVARDLSSDNGAGGDNYTRTFFDDGATLPITTGVAPFTGRFRPEQSLSISGFRGQLASGAWTLRMIDDASGDSGTLTSWSLVACTSTLLARCGNGNVDPGEECDDGNDVNNDTCTNVCGIADGCGDGNVDAGEMCDDDNKVAGDGCSAVCQIENLCPAGSIALAASNNTMTAIPDNDQVTGVSSAAMINQGGSVTAVRVFINSLTHTNDADLDLFLVGPNGVQRELSTDNGGTGDNYTSTLFDDLAISGMADSTTDNPLLVAPFGGSFRPEQTLSARAGTDFLRSRALGNWTLRVLDDAAAGTGSLESWIVFVCVDPAATFCGDAMINGGEECDDGNTVNNDMCSNLCQVADGCGDGNLDAGEQCDDDNIVNGDGCTSTCQVELLCPVGQVLVNVSNNNTIAIPDNDQVTGVSSPVAVAQAGAVTAAKVLIKNITHTADGDLDISLVSPSGVQRDLSSDNGGSSDNFINTVFSDGAATAITGGSAPYTGAFRPEQSLTTTAGVDHRRLSALGNWTLRIFDDAGVDTGSLNGWSLLMCVDPAATTCGDSMVNGGEECDDGNTVNNDGCTNLCQLVDGCGDGNIDGAEECDDDNVASGDGCSSMCKIEITCPAGQVAVTVANNTAAAIPDNDQVVGVSSTVAVAQAGAITSLKVGIRNLTHTADTDLDLFLVAPSGVQRELSTDNGSTGDNYLGTVLFDSAATAITSGTAPFAGSFRPEFSLTTTAGVDFSRLKANGNWTLRVFDDAGGDTGTLNGWVLAACVDPAATTCGDGMVNGGEECDDGNTVNTDACSNLCQVVDGCADGNIDAGEFCDDNNVIAGDGCSPTCTPDISCAAGQMAVTVTNSTAGAIPDTYGGLVSSINIPNAGLVRKAIATLNVSHAVDSHLDIYLMSPKGGPRLLSDEQSGVNYAGTIFSDAATTAITSGVAPFTGAFKPEATLDVFNNQSAQGDWLLRIADDTVGTTGTLNSWALAVCVDPVAPTVCGNGFVEANETCDDGNTNPNDGCSAQCAVELGCVAGQQAVLITSADAKAIIQDNTPAGVTTGITVLAGGNVAKAVVVVNAVAHTYDGDLALSLIAPNAATIDLSSGNGSSSDDYLSTMFADTATSAITSGSPPFRGQFRPEAVLSTVNGQPAAGMWGLKAADTSAGDAGVFRSWTIGLCTTP